MMFSDEELRRAARELSIAMADELPTRVECDHTFSSAFTRCMERLIRRSRHPLLHRSIRSVAGFLLALLLGSGIWLTLDTEAREAFFDWVGERIESAQSYFFSGPDVEAIPDVRYYLKEIPEGYKKIDSFEAQFTVDESYDNETGQILSFGYIFSPTESGGSVISLFDVNKMEKGVVEVNGSPADCFIDSTGEIGNALVWQDKKNGVLLYLIGYFDKDTLIRMAEEVIAEEK